MPLADEVWAAMRAATECNVPMAELQEAAGAEIARTLGIPGAYVTSGAAAALTLAAAVSMTGSDPQRINRLPDWEGMRYEVVVLRAHRDPYDHAVTAVGAELAEVGYPSSTRRAELAHGGGIPVIVDAAMDVPPCIACTGCLPTVPTSWL